ncbi:MAG: hypothetical protein FWF84_06800 [Kiritimatiellaeota bacterium]|nr:hypothetical protein [Kiritimatiellota bacterium]
MPPAILTDMNTAAQVYTDRFIEEVGPILEPVRQFSTDFSEEFANTPGVAIPVPLVTGSEAGDWNKASKNYAMAEASDLDDVMVTIDQRKIAQFAISMEQLATFRPAYWEGKARLNARAIGLAIRNSLFGLVTPANYAKEVEMKAASFAKGDVATLRRLAVESGMEPDITAVCLNPVLFAALLKSLSADVYGGREAIVGGVIPGLFGFRAVVECPNYNGNGFMALPSALASASRPIRPAHDTPYTVFETTTDESTGMAFNTVVLVNGNTGLTTLSSEANYGVAVGDKKALVRIVETATPVTP